MDKSFTQFNFSQQEHPTSVKYNNILDIIEQVRRLTGPISIAATTSGSNTSTSFNVRLIDHPNYIGGITTGPSTRSSFTITYHAWSNDPTSDSSHAIFEHVHFTSGGSDWNYEWYATLDSSNLASGTIGAAAVDLSDVTISSFECMREPYTTGY